MLTLVKNMKDSYPTIKKVTAPLKNSIPMVYTSYILTRLGSRIMPKIFARKMVSNTSRKFTLAFSNLPGPIKPIFYFNEKQEKIFVEWSQNYMMAAGEMGCAITAMSACDSFKVCIVSDNGYLDPKQNKRLN